MTKISLLLFVAIFSLVSSSAWCADDMEIINGDRWLSSNIDQKRAYLFGVGNVLELEEAMMGKEYNNMPKDSIVHVLLKGLSGTSITDMIVQLDHYYSKSSENKKKAVIEVLYIDMAKPNLKR
ncbi:MAG: hypothetical protein KAI02_01905 [Gammaproteobacteria bacterium]|nr:hypothetical protein [Gammaproteobacteria bacterium]